MQGSIDVGLYFVIRRWTIPGPRASISLIALLAFLLAGCSALESGEFSNPFPANPFTGGEPVGTSRLLGLSVPGGMELYASHGFEGSAQDGSSQGLEVMRGYISAPEAASYMFSGMRGQGWNLRQSVSRESQSLQVYEKGDRMATILMRPQAALTIMEIWTGPRLPDGSVLQNRHDFSPDTSISPEVYPPIGAGADAQRQESFGPGEREI